MKKALFIFASLMIFSLSSCIRQNAVTTIGDFTYKMSPRGLRIMSYNGTDSVITIPQKASFLLIHSYDVISIHSLGANKYVHKIIIPDAFNKPEVIHLRAFEECSNLSDIEINEWSRFVLSSKTFESTKIGDALYNKDKTKLYSVIDTEEFTIPSTVKTIAKGAFSNHEQLKRVNLPEGIQEIGSQAFMNCKDLEEITIPSTVNEIEQETFSNNRRLRKVILNEGIQRIGYGAFQDCENLEEIDFPTTVIEIADRAFSNNKQLKRAFLKEGIQRIGSYAFSNCENLEQIGPDGPDVEENTDVEIDDAAENTEPTFDILEETDVIEEMSEDNEDCEETENIEDNEESEDIDSPMECIFPSSLQRIGDYAFSGTGLRNIVLSGLIFDSNTFNNCSRLEYVYLSVKEVPSNAFMGSPNLRNVYFVNGLESIGHDAFKDCIHLREIEIPESVTSIGEDAFPLMCNLNGNRKVISKYYQRQREKRQQESKSETRSTASSSTSSSNTSKSSSNNSRVNSEQVLFRTEQDVRYYLSRHSFKSEGGSKLRFQNNAYEMYWNGQCICTYLKITNIEADGTGAILLADGPYGKAAYAVTLQPFGNSITNLGDGTLYWEVR